MNRRNKKVDTSGAELKMLRLKHRLSLADVARHYSRGVTRARIAHVEASKAVTESADRNYRTAVSAAMEERSRSRKIMAIARTLVNTL
jgi:hypothetical protein